MTSGAFSSVEEALRDGLRELCYIEEKSILIEWRRSLGSDKELRSLASELASAKVELIVVFSLRLPTPYHRPRRFRWCSGRVISWAADWAASVTHPGGQSTEVSMLMPEMVSKRVELLQQVAPEIRRIVFLMNSSNPLKRRTLEEAQSAARTPSVELVALDARTQMRSTRPFLLCLRALPMGSWC